MVSWFLQNDFPALKRKSARFRGAERERSADIPGGGWRKSCAQRAVAACGGHFSFLEKQSLTDAGLYCML